MQTNINVGQGARRTNHPRFSPRPLREVLAGRATSLFYPSPLAGEGRVRGNKKRGITEQGNNFTLYPSSVCSDFVRQTTSPARGEVKRQAALRLLNY